MKREDLAKLGLTDEKIIDAIMDAHGKDIEKQKSAAETAKASADALQSQLAEANKAIEGFKGMDIEGVKKSADEWKSKAEQAQAEAAKQIASLKFDHALDSALLGAKAKNAKAVKALLNSNDLKMAEDGSILGLDKQLESIKKDNDYLFESDKPIPQFITGGQSRSVLPTDAGEAAARKAAGLPPK
jgi:hypothetical protein